jgi:hypothetical protein
VFADVKDEMTIAREEVSVNQWIASLADRY